MRRCAQLMIQMVLQDKERAWLKRRRADYQDVEADADDDQEADDEEETDTPTMSDQEFVASEPDFPLAQSYSALSIRKSAADPGAWWRDPRQ